jgi:hypothetical protein
MTSEKSTAREYVVLHAQIHLGMRTAGKPGGAVDKLASLLTQEEEPADSEQNKVSQALADSR